VLLQIVAIFLVFQFDELVLWLPEQMY